MFPSSTELSNFKRYASFLSDYFLNPESKKEAWALFLGSLACSLAMVGLGFVLGGWFFPYVYAAFMAKDTALLLMGLGAGLLLAAGMAGFQYLANFLKNTLYVNWRSWLTKKIKRQYLFNETNHLKITRLYSDVIDNPEQRIQSDIDKMVESFLDLCLGFITNFSDLIIYTVLLSLAGPSLPLVFFGIPIIIPGFLVLVTLGAGIVTSLLAYFFNRDLPEAMNEETVSQSNLRQDVLQVRTASEEIAIEGGEAYCDKRINNRVDELNIKTKKRLFIQNKTASFKVFNEIVQFVIPLVAAAPLFFTDLLTIEVFYLSGYYVSKITFALSWFINSSETINKFLTSLRRIVSLQEILDKKDDESATKIIRTINHHDKNLIVKNLTLRMHGRNELIFKGLNLEFTPGIHTVIQAPSGTGKSSYFKAIAGTWLSGEGEIFIPDTFESIYFLPQKPTLPNDTLRNVLAYPDGDCPFLNDDDALLRALKEVGMAAFADKKNLDEQIGFKSLGEQQRIAFARVLLRKPKLVFLDEATASLDEDLEEHVYSSLERLLPPGSTIISIAHRSTVRRHHGRFVFFNVDKHTKEIEVKSEMAASMVV